MKRVMPVQGVRLFATRIAWMGHTWNTYYENGKCAFLCFLQYIDGTEMYREYRYIVSYNKISCGFKAILQLRGGQID